MQKLLGITRRFPRFFNPRKRSVHRAPEIAQIEGLEGRLMLIATPFLVKDLFAGASGSNPAQITSAGNVVFFVASPAANDQQLFVSDGTSGGTIQLTSVAQAGGANPTNLTNVNGTLYFAANDGVHGTELWKSNGTAGGTAMVTDINSGAGSSSPHGMVAFNNDLYFVANAGNGQQIFKSNGMPGGTVAVTSINPGGATSFDDLVVQGGSLYFFGDDGIHGPALWKSDGSAGGTAMVKATGTSIGAGGIAQLTPASNQLFFVATDPTNGYQVWRSDGTAGGTHVVNVIDAGITNAVNGPISLTTIGNIAYFSANNGTTGRQLWVSDGTAAGTTDIATINPGAAANPTWLTNFNGELFFAAADATRGNELWQSDGSAAGTTLVTDINPGPGSSDPSGLIDANGTLYFNANDGTHGSQLWQFAGPPSDTQALPVINAAGNAFDNADGLNIMASANGLLFFDASNGATGQELWASQTFPRLATTITVVSSSPRAVANNGVQFTATVAGDGNPTGAVEFFDGTTELGVVGLSAADTATFSTSALSIGNHSITADYLGDGSFTPSTSAAAAQMIVAGAPTTTHVATSATPAAVGTSVIFTVTVTGTGGSPTGVVDFFDDMNLIGTATLDPATGAASVSISTLPLGANSITAIYQGDTVFGASLSNTVAQSIVQSTGVVASSTLLNADNNPATVGADVEFTITVTGTAGSPTGSVDLVDGATPIGSATLDPAGMANIFVSTLAVGTHSITAIYQGDSVFVPSTSNLISQVINPVTTPTTAASTISITSSDNPATIGQAVQFNVTVTGAGNVAAQPSGNVELFDGATSLGEATLLINGLGTFGIPATTSFAISTLSLGAHTITAQYQGDANFSPSTSTALTETINVAPPASPLAASLAGAAGAIPASVVGGAKLHKPIPILVTNPTNAAIKQTIVIALYAATDANSISGGTMIGMITQKISLKPGKGIKLKFKPPTISASIPNGTYNIVAQLTDASNLTALTAYPGTIKIAAPFIAPTASLGPVLPASIAPGKHGTITLTVTNTGNIAATGALSIQIAPSTDAVTPVAGQTLVTMTKHVSIKPAASVKIKLRLTIPSGLAAGQYTPLASVTINGATAAAAGAAFTVG